jgi:predicted ribosome quality control (RQC) complex YloA/Tae2 family protein
MPQFRPGNASQTVGGPSDERLAKLKVFRTPIGFHDAYVAAASQKAALEAWGSDTNLFAQKSAELVTDPALMAEPLASPGKVIKRLRGTAAEQIAALPPNVVRQQSEPDENTSPARAKKAEPKPAKKIMPRPDRSALTKAEQALDDSASQQAAEQKALRDRESALERERRDMDRAHREQTEALEDSRNRAEAAYEKAMKRWRE